MVARPPTSAVDARSVIPARRKDGALFILAASVRGLRPTVFTVADNAVRGATFLVFPERDTTLFLFVSIFCALCTTFLDVVERDSFAFVRTERFDVVSFLCSLIIFSFALFVGIIRDIDASAANAVAVQKTAKKRYDKNLFIFSQIIIPQKRTKKKKNYLKKTTQSGGF
jgi:hypothetical protein